MENKIPILVYAGYIMVMSLVTFAAFGIDKQKAKKHKWRIPEKTLIMLMLLGGVVGGCLGMKVFRNKTKHPKFYAAAIAAAAIGVLMVFLYLILIPHLEIDKIEPQNPYIKAFMTRFCIL